MSNFEDIAQIPQIFNKIATRWHQITQGELTLLSNQGKLIKSYNNNQHDYNDLITVSDEGEVQTLPDSKAIVAPLVEYGRVKGYLLSANSNPEHLPFLTLIAELLLENLKSEEATQGMGDEVIQAWNQLNLVYHIVKTLSETSDLSGTLKSSLEELINVINAEMGFILLTHSDSIECVFAGKKQFSEQIHQQSFVDRFVEGKQILYNNRDYLLEFWPEAPTEVYNLLGTAIATSDKRSAALGLINKQNDFVAGDTKLVSSVSEQIGAIIDNFKLQQEIIARERVKREVEIAAEIQASLLPKTIPDVTGLELDVSIIPASEVGGDFYDFISIDEYHLAIITGDVAGHGIPAAMFTTMVRNMLKIEAYNSHEPHTIVERVSEVLYEDLSQAELYVTACIAIVDTKNKVLTYANAAHTPGIIYHAQSKTSRLLKATALPIGIYRFTDSRPTQYVHLSANDTVVLYSDGVSEAENPEGKRFDFQRIQYLLHKHADKSPREIKEIILQKVSDFQKTEIPDDDVTLIVLKFSEEDLIDEPETPFTVLEQIPIKYKADTVYLTDIAEDIGKICRSLKNLPPEPMGSQFVFLVELTVSEICTNIIEYAYAEKEGYITGQITLGDTAIQIDIYDQGGIDFNPDDIPPPMSDPLNPSEGGYGLHIVRQAMDIAEYTANTPLGNHWKLIKHLPEVEIG